MQLARECIPDSKCYGFDNRGWRGPVVLPAVPSDRPGSCLYIYQEGERQGPAASASVNMQRRLWLLVWMLSVELATAAAPSCVLRPGCASGPMLSLCRSFPIAGPRLLPTR